jgi:hypothetical protein
MLKELLSCFRCKKRIIKACAPHDDVMHDNALHLFYDMCLPTFIETTLRGCSFGKLQPFRRLYDFTFATATNRNLCLGILHIQLDAMRAGIVECDGASLQCAHKWGPILTRVITATAVARRMEAMMEWAMTDPAEHARFLYSVYDIMFAQCRIQNFPSRRAGIPRHMVERYGGDDGVKAWATRSSHHPTNFMRYRHFLEAVWLPYVSQHAQVGQAILDELNRREDTTMAQAYLELGEAMGFAPRFQMIADTLTFTYRIAQTTFVPNECMI